jgi:hypothetical protein
MKITFDTVKKLGLALPGVEESTTFRGPCLKVNGQLITCPAINKSAEPNSIMVRIPIDQRAGMIAEAPETYYVTEHYVSYPCVLVRLSQIQPDALKDLLRTSWQFVSAKKKSGKKAGSRGIS